MLTPAECQIIIDTLMPFEPTYIGIFGSVARGEDTPESDVDILTSFANVVSLFELGGMYADLTENLHREVDLILEKSAPDWLLDEAKLDLHFIYGEKDPGSLKGHA
jgi:uncharacterized protein